MPYAAINGVQVYYERGGTGTPVVYVHGGCASLAMRLSDLTASAWAWEQEFADHFCLLTYDRRGCYRSASPAEGYDLCTQVADLMALLDYLQIPATHMIGSSAGGPIALLCAATQPQRVHSLILTGTALDLFPLGDPGSDLVRQHLALLEREGAEAAFAQRPSEVEVTWGEVWDHTEARVRGTWAEYQARRQQWHERAQQVPHAQRVHYYVTELRSMQAYMMLDMRAYARTITVPALLVHGRNDQLVPVAWAEDLAQTVPTAEFVVVEGGSHTLMVRNAQARQTVMAFMHGVDARRAAVHRERIGRGPHEIRARTTP